MELSNNYRLISNWFRKYRSWNDAQAASFSGPASFVIVIWEDEAPIKAFLMWSENEETARKQFMDNLVEANWMPHWELEVFPFRQNEILDLDSNQFVFSRPLTTEL